MNRKGITILRPNKTLDHQNINKLRNQLLYERGAIDQSTEVQETGAWGEGGPERFSMGKQKVLINANKASEGLFNYQSFNHNYDFSVKQESQTKNTSESKFNPVSYNQYRSNLQLSFKNEYRSDSKAELKPQFKGEYRLEYRPEYKPQYKPQEKPDYRLEFKSEYKPAFKWKENGQSQQKSPQIIRTDHSIESVGDRTSNLMTSSKISVQNSQCRQVFEGKKEQSIAMNELEKNSETQTAQTQEGRQRGKVFSNFELHQGHRIMGDHLKKAQQIEVEFCRDSSISLKQRVQEMSLKNEALSSTLALKDKQIEELMISVLSTRKEKDDLTALIQKYSSKTAELAIENESLARKIQEIEAIYKEDSRKAQEISAKVSTEKLEISLINQSTQSSVVPDQNQVASQTVCRTTREEGTQSAQIVEVSVPKSPIRTSRTTQSTQYEPKTLGIDILGFEERRWRIEQLESVRERMIKEYDALAEEHKTGLRQQRDYRLRVEATHFEFEQMVASLKRVHMSLQDQMKQLHRASQQPIQLIKLQNECNYLKGKNEEYLQKIVKDAEKRINAPLDEKGNADLQIECSYVDINSFYMQNQEKVRQLSTKLQQALEKCQEEQIGSAKLEEELRLAKQEKGLEYLKDKISENNLKNQIAQLKREREQEKILHFKNQKNAQITIQRKMKQISEKDQFILKCLIEKGIEPQEVITKINEFFAK